MSKEIKLTRGMVAIVDDEDFEWLSQWKWHAHKSVRQWYACRQAREKDMPGPRMVRMHRVIIDAPNGVIVDHVNRNSLDNQRANLRLSNHRDNLYNSIWFDLPLEKSTGKKAIRVTASTRMRHGTWTITLTVSRLANRSDANVIAKEIAQLARRLLGE